MSAWLHDGREPAKKLILDMIETARLLSQEPRKYWTDQLNHPPATPGGLSAGVCSIK